MRPLHAVVIGAIGLSLVAAGCGGAIPSSNGGPATLKLMSSKDGMHLVDQSGRSLYLFKGDDTRDSYCYGACAAVWPALETSSMPHAGAGIQASALGTFKRDDGDTQVTYDGHPLYYYAGDGSTAGKTNGQEQEQFGAEWYLVNSSGKSLESGMHSKSYSKTNTGSYSNTTTGSNSNTSTGSSYGGGG
jgi:predicted lipoprotein with Yx(FWY)xxD motif